MSADNWGICPRCKVNAEKEQAKKVKRAEDAYGKVPAETYAQLLREAETEPGLDTTLCEDYEVGMSEDGYFYISYRCGCTECGFSHEFKHESRGHF